MNPARGSLDTRDVEIGAMRLPGTLGVPGGSPGIVLFAHGSGSSRLSPRNNFVARELREAGLATLLLDLLTEEEAQERCNVFDIQLLAQRLLMATAWCSQEPETANLPICYFGASTGAAAALVAAASGTGPIAAIVSRGGRPDLAGADLVRVTAPTLLIVGGADPLVLDLNRLALEELGGEKHLVIVPGASHLFDEAGALESVVRFARDWFIRHLPREVA